MNLIPIDQIIIPEDRHRKEFSPQAIDELAKSIKAHGLFHPIVLRADGKTLVAGERRLRAFTQLYNEKLTEYVRIPYTTLDQCSELELEEVELEENIIREDLSFQERAMVESRLHKLRTKQKAERGEKQTLDDTIGELIEEGGNRKSASARLSRSLVIAEHLDDEDVKKAKTEKEAIKIIERKGKASQREAMAADFEKKKADSPHRVIHGECLEVPKDFPDHTFEVILTDPPYGMGADTFGDMASVTHKYDDSAESFQKLMVNLIPELSRVAKPSAHMYMFCDIEWFLYLKTLVSAAGWKPFRTPLIWFTDNGMLPWIENGPRRRYEILLYAVRGDRPCNRVASDVIQCPRPKGQEYGAQKPVELYTDLLSRSILPGEHVLDCFAGTGPIVPAANLANCRATAIELDKAKYHFILERLEEGK